MSRPFVFRINAAELFTQIQGLNNDEKAVFITQFSVDLITLQGNSDYSKAVIDDTMKLIESKSKNGKKGGRPKKLNKAKVISSLSETKAKSKQEEEKEVELKEEVKEEVKKKALKPLSEYSDDFVKFWSAYPAKTGKGDAWKSWQKMNPQIEKVIEAIQWQINSKKWIDGYIPNPSTYLNQRRWEDEPTKNVVPDGYASKGVMGALLRSAELRQRAQQQEVIDAV